MASPGISRASRVINKERKEPRLVCAPRPKREEKKKRLSKKDIQIQKHVDLANSVCPSRTWTNGPKKDGSKFKLVPLSADFRGYGHKAPGLDRPMRLSHGTSLTHWEFTELQYCKTGKYYSVIRGNRRIRTLQDEGKETKIAAWVKEYKNLGGLFV